MSYRLTRNRAALASLLAGGLIMALLPEAVAQQPGKVQPPEWSHAFDLKCRPPGKDVGFDKANKYGVECFRDANNGEGIYITEVGDLAVLGGFKDAKVPAPKGKTPKWMHGIDLKVRPAGTTDWAKGKLVGVEVFRDEVNGNWVYITDKGFVSVLPGAKGLPAPTDPTKTPVWVHGFDLQVRKAGEKVFDKNTKTWSVEVFRDENNGNLIYICESGYVAVVSGGKDLTAPLPNAKNAKHLHGLDLKVRPGGNPNFGAGSKAYGIEAFRDDNTGNLIYITETGSLAVVTGKEKLQAPTDNPSEPIFTHGLDLKCRRYGETDWKKDTPLFGIEVFADNNTGSLIYIIDTGAIAATAKK
jgi:hypothetical protein